MATGGTLWLALAALVQLSWGIYPAALRYLQTDVPHRLTSLQLSFLINACACPAMLLQTLSTMLVRGCRRCSRRDPRRLPSKPKASADQQPGGAEDGAQEPLLAVEGMHPANPSASSCKRFGVLCATTAALTTLMVSQIFALMFVEAYISQMVFLLAPLLVSCLALFVLRTPLPPKFWPTLLLMLAGSGMVVGGKAEAAQDAASNAGWALAGLPLLHTERVPGGRLGLLVFGASAVVNWDDVAGVGLSLLSALALAIFMLIIQVAGKYITNEEVLWCNFPTQALLSFTLTCVLERSILHTLGHLLPWEWAAVACTSIGVNWAGNLLQQITIKELGAPQVASFLPLRLVGSLAASYVILGEGLDNWLEAAGAALVLLTLSGYLYAQKRHAEAQALAEMVAEAERQDRAEVGEGQGAGVGAVAGEA